MYNVSRMIPLKNQWLIFLLSLNINIKNNGMFGPAFLASVYYGFPRTFVKV